MKKIMVVDDEKRIVEILKAYIEREGYQVITAFDGKAALEQTHQQHPDLIVLDLMLPEISGWDVCRAIRRESAIPIVMLTARDDVRDKISGLEMGADDYITKPFDPKEVVSRVRAVLRRTEEQTSITKPIHICDLSIDLEKRRVQRGKDIIDLTTLEFDLLCVLAENPGRVYSRMQLLDKTQKDACEGYERTIDVHIKNLRKKIEIDPEHPRLIVTIHGVGYKIA
jgi:two-component system, OmpR family, response regulator